MNGLTQQVAREVLVYNQPKQKYFVFLTATDKWSDIADLIMKQPELECSSLSNMKAVLQSNKSTLELPEATIPVEGAQKIFLFESKVKSGAVNYSNLSFTELRQLAKTKGLGSELGSNPTKKGLIEVLETAAEIKKEKISKTGKTGKITTKKVVTTSPKTDSIKKADREILDNQPNLSERVASLEEGFAKLVGGMFATCSDFVQPTIVEKKEEVLPKTIGEIDFAELSKEASALKVK